MEVVTDALDYLETAYLAGAPFRNRFHYAYCLRDLAFARSTSGSMRRR